MVNTNLPSPRYPNLESQPPALLGSTFKPFPPWSSASLKADMIYAMIIPQGHIDGDDGVWAFPHPQSDLGTLYGNPGPGLVGSPLCNSSYLC